MKWMQNMRFRRWAVFRTDRPARYFWSCSSAAEYYQSIGPVESMNDRAGMYKWVRGKWMRWPALTAEVGSVGDW